LAWTYQSQPQVRCLLNQLPQWSYHDWKKVTRITLKRRRLQLQHPLSVGPSVSSDRFTSSRPTRRVGANASSPPQPIPWHNCRSPDQTHGKGCGKPTMDGAAVEHLSGGGERPCLACTETVVGYFLSRRDQLADRKVRGLASSRPYWLDHTCPSPHIITHSPHHTSV
jgi:hypothetical protein